MFGLADSTVNLQYIDNLNSHQHSCVATVPHEILMSENKRQSETDVMISDKSHDSVATNLKYGGFFSNHTDTDLLLRLLVKKF